MTKSSLNPKPQESAKPPESARSLSLVKKRDPRLGSVLPRHPKKFSWERAALFEILSAYSHLFFLNHPGAGLAILMATFLDFNVGICGLVAALVGMAFLRIFGSQTSLSTFRMGILNAILVGLVLGSLVRLDTASLCLLVILSVGTLGLTSILEAWFSSYQIPVLSLPFSLVGVLLYRGIPQFSNLFILRGHDALLENTREWGPYLLSVIAGLGNIIATPYAGVGALLLGLIFFHSRFSFLFALLGLGLGQVLEWLWGTSTLR